MPTLDQLDMYLFFLVYGAAGYVIMRLSFSDAWTDWIMDLPHPRQGVATVLTVFSGLGGEAIMLIGGLGILGMLLDLLPGPLQFVVSWALVSGITLMFIVPVLRLTTDRIQSDQAAASKKLRNLVSLMIPIGIITGMLWLAVAGMFNSAVPRDAQFGAACLATVCLVATAVTYLAGKRRIKSTVL